MLKFQLPKKHKTQINLLVDQRPPWQKDLYKFWLGIKKEALIGLAVYFILIVFLNIPLWMNRVTPPRPLANVPVFLPPVSEAVEVKEELAPTQATQLLVPKLGVIAPIVDVSSFDEPVIQEGLKHGVVRYPGTGIPGKAGNNFITGHSSVWWWETGDYKYVFMKLDQLTAGDEAIVYYQGKIYRYRFLDAKLVDPADTSVIDPTPEPILTLMTCWPPGTVSKRLVVRFEQTSPAFIPEPTVLPTAVAKADALPAPDQRSLWELVKGIFKRRN